MNTDILSSDVFAPYIGHDFSLLHQNQVCLTARLADCTTHPRSTMPGTERTAFSLALEVPARQIPAWHGGLFTVRHEEIGEFGPVHVGRVISIRQDVAMLEIIFN